MALQELIDQIIEETGLPACDPDAKITGYHATNVSLDKIGLNKKTMFFTTDRESAEDWGEDHYGEYEIHEVEVPLSSIYEFIAERPQFSVHDFERLEFEPEKMKGDVCYFEDCCNGFIVKDITKFSIR